MTDETILMRQGMKSLPDEMFEAMISRREMFGTSNPHVFDYVYAHQEHYRVTLEFEEEEKAENFYVLRDYVSVEYTDTLGNEPRRYAMTDADHTKMVQSLNAATMPMFELQGVRMEAERNAAEMSTRFNLGVIFGLNADRYLIHTKFDLMEDELRDNPKLGDRTHLHEHLCEKADKVLWERVPYVVGRYAATSLYDEARYVLRKLLVIGPEQTALRNGEAQRWSQAWSTPIKYIYLDFEPPKKRRRRIDLWGDL